MIVYCDQPFFVHVCLFVGLVGCSCVPEIRERKKYNPRRGTEQSSS